MTESLSPDLPQHVDITLEAATDQALRVLQYQHGLLVDDGEGPPRLARGVIRSHIGDGVLDGLKLDGRYCFIGIDTAVYGTEQTAALLLAVQPHRYMGPDLRARIGGSGFDDAAVVPQTVPMAEARKAMLLSGKFGKTPAELDATVRAAFAGLPEPQKSLALIDWEFQPNVRLKSAFTQAAVQALGLTDKQVQDLFVATRNV